MTPADEQAREIAGLRAALEVIRDDGVPREVSRLGRQLGKEWCQHGVYTDLHCEICVQDFAGAALREMQGETK